MGDKPEVDIRLKGVYGRRVRKVELLTSWGRLLLVGGSRAGEGTVVLLPQLRLALDAGRPSRALVPMEHVVISHGHTDHLSALPFWASQRQLQNLPAARLYAPAEIASELSQLLALVASLERGKLFAVELVPVREGDEVALRKDMVLRFFRTSHWVPTLGTLLVWKKKQLKPSFLGLPSEELATLRQKGIEVEETIPVPLLAYLADTGPEVLGSVGVLTQVEVLVVECSFLSPRDVERARRFGHMHLADLQAFIATTKNRYLVLTHLSRRHRLGPGSKKIRQTLQRPDGPQILLLNVEWT